MLLTPDYDILWAKPRSKWPDLAYYQKQASQNANTAKCPYFSLLHYVLICLLASILLSPAVKATEIAMKTQTNMPSPLSSSHLS